MLVLTRKLQERIKIGDNVTITVLRVKGNTVRIGIEAPRSVRVIRAELPADGQAVVEVAAEVPAGDAVAVTRAEAGSAEDEGRASPQESDGPTAASPLRYPQRRITNRRGTPPLRLACSHALSGSWVMS